MQQTPSVKDHLRAFNEQIKAAAEKNANDSKDELRRGLQHLDAAKAQVQKDISTDNAIRKQEAQEMLAKIEELAETARRSLNDTGNSLREHIKAIAAKSKSAIDSVK
jgi:predicted phage gp36 major capsid-like protein